MVFKVNRSCCRQRIHYFYNKEKTATSPFIENAIILLQKYKCLDWIVIGLDKNTTKSFVFGPVGISGGIVSAFETSLYALLCTACMCLYVHFNVVFVSLHGIKTTGFLVTGSGSPFHFLLFSYKCYGPRMKPIWILTIPDA